MALFTGQATARMGHPLGEARASDGFAPSRQRPLVDGFWNVGWISNEAAKAQIQFPFGQVKRSHDARLPSPRDCDAAFGPRPMSPRLHPPRRRARVLVRERPPCGPLRQVRALQIIGMQRSCSPARPSPELGLPPHAPFRAEKHCRTRGPRKPGAEDRGRAPG